jgi:hypothetical protein
MDAGVMTESFTNPGAARRAMADEEIRPALQASPKPTSCEARSLRVARREPLRGHTRSQFCLFLFNARNELGAIGIEGGIVGHAECVICDVDDGVGSKIIRRW